MPQRKPVINNKYHDTVLLLKGYRGAKIAVQESAMDHKEQLQEELVAVLTNADGVLFLKKKEVFVRTQNGRI